MVAGVERHGDGSDVQHAMPGSGVGVHRVAVDVEGEAVIRAGTESVSAGRGDFEEAAESGEALNRGPGHGERTVGEVAVTETGRQEGARTGSEARALGGHLTGRRSGQADEVAPESAGGIPEGGHVRGSEQGALHAEGIVSAQRDRAGRKRGGGPDRHQVREDERSLADVDRLVSLIVKHVDGSSGRDVDLRDGAADGVSGDVEQPERVTVLSADVQDLAAEQGQARNLDRVGGVGAVVADVQVGGGIGAVDGDAGRVTDQSEAARAVVQEGEHASVADGHVGAGEDRGRGAGVQSGQGQRAGVDGHASGESVVVAEEQRPEPLLGEPVGAARVVQHHVQGEDRLRRLDVDGRVPEQGRGRVVALDRQVVRAPEGDLVAREHQGVAQRVGGGGREVGAGGPDGQGARADRTAGEGRDDSGRPVARRHVGAAADGESARVHAHAAAEEAGSGELEQAVAGLGDAHGRVVRGAADRRRDGEGRRGVGHGGVAVDRDRADIERAGGAAQVEGDDAARAGDGGSCSGDQGDLADIGRTGGHTAGQGQDARAGAHVGLGRTAVIDEVQAGQGLVEVVEIEHARAPDLRHDAGVDLAGGVEPDGGAVDDEVAGRDGDGRTRIGAAHIETQSCGVGHAAVDDGSARVGVGGGQDRRDGIRSAIDQPGGSPGPVVGDAGVEGDGGPLIHHQVERRGAGTLIASRSDLAGADALARLVAGDDETAGSEVQRVVRRVGEREGLVVRVRNPSDGVGQIGAGRAGVDVGNDERGAGKRQVASGRTAVGGQGGGVIARITGLVQRRETSGDVA